jgi:hypothetical protein
MDQDITVSSEAPQMPLYPVLGIDIQETAGQRL